MYLSYLFIYNKHNFSRLYFIIPKYTYLIGYFWCKLNDTIINSMNNILFPVFIKIIKFTNIFKMFLLYIKQFSYLVSCKE